MIDEAVHLKLPHLQRQTRTPISISIPTFSLYIKKTSLILTSGEARTCTSVFNLCPL